MECRKSGPSKVLLSNKFRGIWIEEADKISLLRWKKQPKEMARRLLRIFVGTKNLKNMCARGRSSEKIGVPKDISSLVDCKME